MVDATGARSLAQPLNAPSLPVPPTELECAMVGVGSCALEVIHMAGHTPGGIALLYRDPEAPPHLFTGDGPFRGRADRLVVLRALLASTTRWKSSSTVMRAGPSLLCLS